MAAGTWVFCFLIICSLVCSSRDQKNITAKKITAELGQDVNLTCKVPNISVNNIRAVKWSRPDHDPEYVLYYRDGHFDPDNQHPSYKNRVDLQDEEMKDGNFSLILKNVTMEDRGTYKCWVYQRKKFEHISVTYMEVVEPGDKDENTGDGGDKDGGDKDGGDKDGIIVGSVVGVILLAVAFLGFLIYRRSMGQNPHILVPHYVKAAAEQMLCNKDMKVFYEQHQKQPELV